MVRSKKNSYYRRGKRRTFQQRTAEPGLASWWQWDFLSGRQGGIKSEHSIYELFCLRQPETHVWNQDPWQENRWGLLRQSRGSCWSSTVTLERTKTRGESWKAENRIAETLSGFLPPLRQHQAVTTRPRLPPSCPNGDINCKEAARFEDILHKSANSFCQMIFQNRETRCKEIPSSKQQSLL